MTLAFRSGPIIPRAVLSLISRSSEMRLEQSLVDVIAGAVGVGEGAVSGVFGDFARSWFPNLSTTMAIIAATLVRAISRILRFTPLS